MQGKGRAVGFAAATGANADGGLSAPILAVRRIAKSDTCVAFAFAATRATWGPEKFSVARLARLPRHALLSSSDETRLENEAWSEMTGRALER